jgi:hypothetical protein
MKNVRLFTLVEGYLEGTLTDDERRELTAAVEEDPAVRQRFVEQVLLARRLGAILRPRPAGDLWAKIDALVTPDELARRRQVADRIDAAIDRARPAPRGRQPRRWMPPGAVVAAAVAAGAVAASAGAMLWMRRAPAPDAPPPEQVAVSPAPAEPAPPASAGAGHPPTSPRQPAPAPAPGPGPVAVSPPAAPAPAPATAAAEFRAELAAAEDPELAQRPDVLNFVGFDRAPLPRPAGVYGRFRPAVIELVPGVTGNGLRIHFNRDESGPRAGAGRLFVASAAQTGAATAEPPDEMHLRFRVRAGDDFDFAPGGALPGLCFGRCRPAARLRGAGEGGLVRVGWAPTGELFFIGVPGGTPRAHRWRRALARGAWQAVELRVKLNTPGAADGAVEGWLDGQPAISISGLRLREDPATRVEGAVVEAFYRKARGLAPARDGHLTFDDIVLARRPIGPGRARPR